MNLALRWGWSPGFAITSLILSAKHKRNAITSSVASSIPKMQIKNFPSSGPEAVLQEPLITVQHVDFKDGTLDSLFEKLSIVARKGEEVDQPTYNLDRDTVAGEPNANYDESQLIPKGPYRTKDISARDLPYEQRTLNKNLMNGGGMVEKDRQCIHKLRHEMIPLTVQNFQSQSVSDSVVPANEACYQTYPQFISPAGLGMGNPNIPLVANTDWQPSSFHYPRTPLRVDSPQSSDSGINSPSSSPNTRCQTWPSEQPSLQGCAVPSTVSGSNPQMVDSPCSPESGYFPSSSPEIHSQWPCDQQSPEPGFYETVRRSSEDEASTGEVSYTSHSWGLDSFEYPDEVGMANIQTDWFQKPYQNTTEVIAQQNHSTTPYGSQADDLIEYPNNSERPCDSNIPLGQMGENQWLKDALEELVRELSYLDGPVAIQALPQAEPPATQPTPTPPPSASIPSSKTTEPEPKVKNSRTKNKPPRPERTPQQKRKTNKSPPLDNTKPKICYMIDQKKEATKVIWMGISLMSEDKFTKKNKNGQTCLMEVLLAEKLSIERVYFIVQRMKKNGDLLSSKDNDGKNALYLAATRHQHIPELASFIAESYASSGLDVNEDLFEEKKSLIHCLVEKGKSHHDVLCELLDIKYEGRRLFNPNSTNAKGDSPLHLVLKDLPKKSYPFDLSLVDILLKRGASISVQNSAGETPLHLAAKNACDDKVFRKLFERLSLPPEEKQSAMNIQDCGGNTPLHLVACHINPCNVEKMKKVMKVLLSEKNTLTNIKNNDGTTPFENIHQACIKEFHDLFHKRK